MRVNRIKRARAHQRLDDAPVNQAPINAAAEIKQVGKQTISALGDDVLDRRLAGAFHGSQAVADIVAIDRHETAPASKRFGVHPQAFRVHADRWLVVPGAKGLALLAGAAIVLLAIGFALGRAVWRG